MKKISPRLKLKDNHPTMVKFYKLMNLAEDLGISFAVHSSRWEVIDSDRDPNLPPLWLEDIEDGLNSMGEFPPITECKMVYDNPAYLEEQKRLAEEFQAAQKVKKEEEQRAKDFEKARLKALQEAQEKLLLKNLKLKYEPQIEHDDY
jgi:hypothetical protein